MAGPDRGKLLSPSTAADHYGISRRKIYNWVRARRFRFIKPEREILFWESDFEAFLDSHTIPAKGEDDFARG